MIPPEVPPSREVAVLIQATDQDKPKAMRSALAGLPASATRISFCFDGPPLEGGWRQETSYYPREMITRCYYGQPTVTIMGRLKPCFDEASAIYPKPLAPTQYKPYPEPIRLRNRRFLREAWEEVSRIATADA